MTMTIDATSKGKLVIVELERSFTDSRMKVRKYNTYFIGRATIVTPEGLVTTVRRPKGDKVVLGKAHRVYVISDPEKQDKLERLTDSLAKDEDNYWINLTALKNMILNA